MKKLFVFLTFALLFIILAGTISATIETDYYIYEKKVLVRHSFEEKVSDLELRIPSDYSALQINSGYNLEKSANYYLIKINSADNLSISYITQSMIDKSENQYFFVARNYLDKPQNVKLVLPESAVLLEEGIVSPEPDEISSDGRSIILKWENYNEKQIVVDYEFLKNRNFIYYLIFGFLILIFLACILFERKKHKEKLKKVKIKNKKTKPKSEIIEEHLMESEKAIINELKKAEKTQLWQKQLQTNTGFSKAKLSRVIRNLEIRNLIQKIPLGNTNKIKLKFK